MSETDRRIAHIQSQLLAKPAKPGLSDVETDIALIGFADSDPVPAAVLIALIPRGRNFTVVYTQRSASLRAHSGQIAFPGGKLDPEDADEAAAALREAAEEVALIPDEAKVIGYLEPLYTGTNYLITPVVAVVQPSAPFMPNPYEVDEVFEVPLSKIAQIENYGTYHIEFAGKARTTPKIEHEGRVIWGITAILTERFRNTALRGDFEW